VQAFRPAVIVKGTMATRAIVSLIGAAGLVAVDRLFPGDYPEVPEGGAVWVFGLN
jgi:hypothetical protein